MTDITLTGITTTGTPHIGNYVGAIRPAVTSQGGPGQQFFFLADYHALVKTWDPERVKQSTLEIAASWLAAGIDPDRVYFYRQSDIPEIPQLTWVLMTLTAKGLMNRAHAYKAAVADNEAAGSKDPDKGITMGLFGYPVLMAADILMFSASKVPVGRDQKQHVEMARDIAGRFNHVYQPLLTLPEAVIDDNTATLAGLDGRKMSKSYDNVIPLFAPEKKLRKLIMRIKTNSLEPGEPKDPDTCTLFGIYRAFATQEETQQIRKAYAEGIAWGEMKQQLFAYLNDHLKDARVEYEKLMSNPGHVEAILKRGAERAREVSRPLMDRIRDAVGIRALC